MPWPVHPTGFFGARGDNDTYQIERSLRFNSADSAYLSRTPASAGNRKTWTWSGWVKKTRVGASPNTYTCLLSSGTTVSDTNTFNWYIYQDVMYLQGGITIWRQPTQLFRDSSAWYHIVLSVDTTQSTANDRIKIYVNGSQITSFATTNNPSQNSDLGVNQAIEHNISRDTYQQPSYPNYFDGYLAEINFIDGQALTPSSFGETDAITGRWKAKAFGGTYGTNGFYLKFADNSGTTSTTLGKDSRGNGNNWTPNNFSVTAGEGNDSLVDSPTNYGTDSGVGGEVRGNYCTLNPLDMASSTTAIAVSNGNLEATFSGGAAYYATIKASMPCSYKCYYEGILPNNTGGDWWFVGWVRQDTQPTSVNTNITSSTYYPNAGAYYFVDDKFFVNGSIVYDSSQSWADGDLVMFAFDPITGKCWIGRNGTWLNSGNPASGTGAIGTLDTSFGYTPAFNSGGNHKWTLNFGQRPFAYTAPSGFKALCTTNLDKTIGITTTGTFTGNANADGPFVYLNGVPTAMTINGNAVTFQTHADKLSNGFKVRTNSTSYNASGSNTFSVSTTAEKFKYARAQSN
jgi:hypothetical protein